MQKQDVINLINCGILHMSAHELGPEHAYKVFILKRQLEKAYNAITDEQNAILNEVGIDDSFKQKATDINKKTSNKEVLTIEEREWLSNVSAIQQSADKLMQEMQKSEITIDGLKTIPYETWRELQKENRAKLIGDKAVDILGGPAEIILADIFWKAPEEKSE